MIKKWFRKFSIPKNLAILNGILIAIIIAANIYFQAFCIPTTWAIILLTICFSNTIIYPFLEKEKFYPISSFINGLTFSIFIYCVVFLERTNLLGIVGILFGFGLIILTPHFFIVQLLWKTVIKPVNKKSRLSFGAAVLISILTTLYIGKQYEKATQKINEFVQSDYKNLTPDFMTEKILGMHFIYHTRFCEYDGWRPPKHEPILVIGMWLNDRIDPLTVDLSTRIDLYKKIFPKNKVKFDCSCAIEYNDNYHNDPIWKNKPSR
jgi:hypothetical protein